MKRTIMIVDDSLLSRHEIETLLDGTDFEVVGQCRRGEEALELFDELTPDIVIMDIIMPGIDGIEASRRLLEAHPGTGLIIVSSLAFDDTLNKVKQLGDIPFVFKPIKKSYFLNSLLTVADSLSKK